MDRTDKSIFLLIVIIVLTFVVGGLVLFRMQHDFAKPTPTATPEPTPTGTPAPTAAPDSGLFSEDGLTETVNILLVGVDSKTLEELDQQVNADGLILATLNPDTKEIVFTSFMRDTRVRVNNSGYDKLTNVYYTGGIELLRKTLEENFEIPIHYYAIFNYIDVAEIVDAVGGIEVVLTPFEIEEIEGKIKQISILTGTNYEDNAIDPSQAGQPLTLNGVQAAGYTRLRWASEGGDAGRTERGRDVISCIMSKAFNLNGNDMLRFIQVFLQKIDTDIPDSFMRGLGANYLELRDYKQVSDRIPIDGSYEAGDTGSGYYVIPNFEVNNKHLQDSIFNGIHE